MCMAIRTAAYYDVGTGATSSFIYINNSFASDSVGFGIVIVRYINSLTYLFISYKEYSL